MAENRRSVLKLKIAPGWRNWQTQRAQNPPRFTPRGGSTPPPGTNVPVAALQKSKGPDHSGPSVRDRQELTALVTELFGQEAARSYRQATEWHVATDHNRLVRNHTDGKRHVGHAVESLDTRAGLRRDPAVGQRGPGRERHGIAARLTRISYGRIRSGNGYPSQVVSILVQDIHGDVGGRRAPVEDVEKGVRSTGRIGETRGCAGPDEGWSACRGARWALRPGWSLRPCWPLRSGRSLRTSDVPLHESFIRMASGARVDQAHQAVARVDARIEYRRIRCDPRGQHQENNNSRKTQTGNAGIAHNLVTHTHFSSRARGAHQPGNCGRKCTTCG